MQEMRWTLGRRWGQALQIVGLCLNLRFHRRCVGCYRGRYRVTPGLYLLVGCWLVFLRICLALLFSCETLIFLLNVAATATHSVFLVVSITITTIIIVMIMMMKK